MRLRFRGGGFRASFAEVFVGWRPGWRNAEESSAGILSLRGARPALRCGGLVGLGVAVTLGALGPAASGAGTGRLPPPPSGITFAPPSAAVRSGSTPPAVSTVGSVAGFTANARVNQNAGSLGLRQVEPAAASNPLDRMMMVAGFADSLVDSIPGVSRSVDGGKNWSAPTGGALLPNPTGLAWGSRSSVGHVAGADNSVAWGTGNTVYVSTLGNQDDSNPPTAGVCNVGGTYVYRSS